MGLDPTGMKPRDMSFLRISCYFIFVCELMNALAKIKLVRKFWFFALLLIYFSPLTPKKTKTQNTDNGL